MSAPICYFDTSALVKLYVFETGSSEIAALFGSSERSASHEIAYVVSKLPQLRAASRKGSLSVEAARDCRPTAMQLYP
ncbi:MAG: hypothetical protein Q8O79_05360 [Pseudomonadota bacterium]|nr:hypothetical protein [Pseudomonadota bacterium]